jgi:acetylornithine deacetylase/succinyl-diaminopimelate desuccinylase-like protein
MKDTDSYMSELMEFIAIPSISADPAYRKYLLEASSWLEKRLAGMGAQNVRSHDYCGIPMVTGDLFCENPEAPTLLLYGHYDVQPSGPEDLWESPPFKPERRGENLYGRGATDMKGQILALFAALDSCLKNRNSSWNYRFLFEGAEESDGSLLDGFIKEITGLLECDLVLNVDAGMVGADFPSIVYGCRGITGGKLIISGPAHDLHCGEFGGVVLNPVHALCKVIAGLHDELGRVALPGFYEDLNIITEEERALLAKLPMNEDFFRKETGVKHLWGEPGFTALERSVLRPILEVVDLQVSGMSSSISPEASALLYFRLVPDQLPAKIKTLLEKYLDATVPDAVNWRLESWIGCKGTVCNPFSPAAQGLKEALKNVWQTEPLLTRSGGSLPMAEYLHQRLNVEVLLTGFQLPEDNMHGPNEKLHIPTWEKGCQALQLFFQTPIKVK